MKSKVDTPAWSIWHVSDADFADKRDALADGLECALTEVKRDPSGPGLVLDFVLRNVGKTPIRIYQRWNSWGAYQWRFVVVDAEGRGVVAGNPQEVWTRNAPTAIAIQPGASTVMTAVLHVDRSFERSSDADDFVMDAKLVFPLRVRGVFESRPADVPQPKVAVQGDGTVPSTELWAGSIATAWVEVR